MYFEWFLADYFLSEVHGSCVVLAVAVCTISEFTADFAHGSCNSAL